jgi:hypothetical protein
MFKSNIKKLNKENVKFAIEWDKHEKADLDKSEIIIIKKQQIRERAFQFIADKDEIFLPKPNEMIRIVVKRIPSETLIYKITESEIIEEMTIAIFSISKKIILSISDLVDDNKVLKLNILVSDMWAKLKKEGDFLFLQENLKIAKIGSKRVHTKIMIARTNLGNFYVYEGSGNLSTNTNFEQYIFENSKESYDFHYKWITEFIEK